MRMPFILTTGTWGPYNINTSVFNTCSSEKHYIRKRERDPIFICLKISNLVLTILGYIPGVNFYSGGCRIIYGLGIIYKSCHSNVGINDKYEYIIGVYKRGVYIGVCQIVRGILEMLNKRQVNRNLDIAWTIPNIIAIPDAIFDYIGSPRYYTRNTLKDPSPWCFIP